MRRKRPLRVRSERTTFVTSRPPSAGIARANGTIAIGTGSTTAFVIWISSSARAGSAAHTLRSAIGASLASILFQVVMHSSCRKRDGQIPIEQRRVGWRRQRRGIERSILDGFLQQVITPAGAFAHFHVRHDTSGGLRQVHHARNTGLRIRRPVPRTVDAIRYLAEPGPQGTARAQLAHPLLFLQALAQLRLALG